ncbi:molybdopterin-dependent oxidoreductase [Leeia sp. TBRC 13508]|uniref:Molybdopterin-dependent oxidoreductase n=1 Tax=Leeia speluncae TaxID=2884804 RepID=A0ABS8D8Y1_9NEIS|nr:molybdopterin-dependent oxidoreductase [Leeia speluncae]MCB6184483.1 molybdopterin-dependent oxidoreductase [Leeia speluncae]
MQGLLNRWLGVGVVAISLAVSTAYAEDLPAPKGPVVLTITGNLTKSNKDAHTAQFDMEMLKKIGMKKVQTSTTWTKGKPTFEGPLARDILKLVGATGAKVNAIAINDYKVEIPTADFTKYDVIIAATMDGKAMSRRDKGPLWVIYPRDQHPELVSPEADSKFLWQLKALDVK